MKRTELKQMIREELKRARMLKEQNEDVIVLKIIPTQNGSPISLSTSNKNTILDYVDAATVDYFENRRDAAVEFGEALGLIADLSSEGALFEGGWKFTI